MKCILHLQERTNMFLGVKSAARSLILGSIQKPQHTGFAAYRATVDVQKIASDPDISWLLEKPSLNIWYVVRITSRTNQNVEADA